MSEVRTDYKVNRESQALFNYRVQEVKTHEGLPEQSQLIAGFMGQADAEEFVALKSGDLEDHAMVVAHDMMEEEVEEETRQLNDHIRSLERQLKQANVDYAHWQARHEDAQKALIREQDKHVASVNRLEAIIKGKDDTISRLEYQLRKRGVTPDPRSRVHEHRVGLDRMTHTHIGGDEKHHHRATYEGSR